MREVNFKHTEIGPIPHDWEVFSVGNDCYIKARIGWQGLTTAEYLDHGEYGLITSTDIVDGKINWQTCWFVSEERYRQDTKIQICEDDVLISKDGTIGKVGIVKKLPYPATLNSGVFVIRTRNSKQSQKGLSLAFISSYFDDFIKRLTAGSTIVHLYQKDIVNYAYPLPPTLAEQERIAGALSSIDTLIGALYEQIEKKRHIKQGTMQQLLTGKKRLAGFTGEWVTEIIKDICDRYDHLRIPVAANFRIKGLTPYYGANGIQDYVDGYTHDGEFILLAEDGANNLVDYPIRYVSGKIWVNNHAHVLSAKEKKADTRFLAYVLKTIDFESNIVGSGRAKLNAETLMQLEVSIPPTIAEQSAIAAVLSRMDTEIAALEQKRDKYIAIKSGMMQDLLTGKIRLV